MRIRNLLGTGVAGLLFACNGTVSLGSGADNPDSGGSPGLEAGPGDSSSGLDASDGDGATGSDSGGTEASIDACVALAAACPVDAPTNQSACALGCGQTSLACHYDCVHGNGFVTNATCDGHTWSVVALLIPCAPPSDAGPSPCQSDADCANGGQCGFPMADGCSAVGTCFPAPTGPRCNAIEAGCACDGTVINILNCGTGLPTGYVPKPLLHSGTCSADGGAPDAAADAGDCCPATWDLYACTFADGGGGMACHNPQMGCASGTTCGTGCDRVVTGTCGP